MVRTVLLLALVPQLTFAQGDFRRVTGWKHPSSLAEGTAPVAASVLTLPAGAAPAGFTELLPFALKSPDQDEAGSCLYMSLTGIAEWWLARLHPELSREADGPLDLSERYLMNYAGLHEEDNGVEDWMTDSAFLFNKAGGTLLNRDYRFTKGWFLDGDDGYERATQGQRGAEYGVQFNWVDDTSTVGGAPRVALPKFQRGVIAKGGSTQWDTGVLPQDVAAKVKAALLERKAPVHVIYNHEGYWHATVVLGFDDDADNEGCSFIAQFFTWAADHEKALREKIGRASGEAKAKLEEQLKKTERNERSARAAFTRGGGCHTKGVFYVRDSIYPDPAEGSYMYDPANRAGDGPYSKRIVLLEQDWLRVLANHVTQIWAE